MDTKLSKFFRYTYNIKETDAHLALTADPNMPEPNRFVGIEVEVERVAPDRGLVNPDLVMVTEDGSLRNNGLEYVTHPTPANKAMAVLEHLYAGLRPTADFTPRTSIHVHVNARDLTVGQLRSIIQVYLACERMLYRWVGGKRAKSIFCVPLLDTNLVGGLLPNFEASNPMAGFNWLKYSGLNLLPLRDKGTIEFRHLYGTRDLKTIQTWLYTILSIFKYARENHPNMVQERVFSLNSTSLYHSFIQEVFGYDLAEYLKDPKHYIKDIEEGISYLKMNSYHNKFRDVVLERYDQKSLLGERMGFNSTPRSRATASTFFSNTSTYLWAGQAVSASQAVPVPEEEEEEEELTTAPTTVYSGIFVDDVPAHLHKYIGTSRQVNWSILSTQQRYKIISLATAKFNAEQQLQATINSGAIAGNTNPAIWVSEFITTPNTAPSVETPKKKKKKASTLATNLINNI